VEDFLDLCKELTSVLQNAYKEGVTMDEAEKLAAKFLYAQVKASQELAESDLDTRMRKTGLKSVKAAVYMENAKKEMKKPSDVMLEASVNLDEIVQKEQESFDMAEVRRDKLQNYFNIFKEAHIYFRGIAKGRFE